MKTFLKILSVLIILVFSYRVDAKKINPDFEIGFGTVSTSNGFFTRVPFINMSTHTAIYFNTSYLSFDVTLFPFGFYREKYKVSVDLNYAMGVYYDFTKNNKKSNILLLEGDLIFYYGEGKDPRNDGSPYLSYTLSAGPGAGYKFVQKHTRFPTYFLIKSVLHFVFWEQFDGIKNPCDCYSRLVNYAIYSSFGIVF